MKFIWLCHEYSDICMNMSQISSTCVWVRQLKPDYISVKYAHMTYNIFTTFVGRVLVVHELILPKTLIGCISHLRVCKTSENILYLYIFFPFDIQAVVFWNNYRRVFHPYGYQGWYYENDVIDIPAVLLWSNIWSCQKWDTIP